MTKGNSSRAPQKASLRSVFQILLQNHVQTIAEMEQLASDLRVSLSLVKKMVYKGAGGLDIWGEAFQILFHWDEVSFSDLKNDLRKKTKKFESDKIWFSIRDDLDATESEMYYLAACAREAFRLKKEIEELKSKKKKASGAPIRTRT